MSATGRNIKAVVRVRPLLERELVYPDAVLLSQVSREANPA